MDLFTVLSTLLEVQVYYYIPVAGFSQDIFKRNALRCHTTAQSLIRLAMKLHGEISFLSHAPHFVCRSLLTAACATISSLVSPTLKDCIENHIQQDGYSTDALVAEAISVVRFCSVQDGDLPTRASKMLESAWNIRHMLPATEFSHLALPEQSHRMRLGLPLDCIRRWKLAMDQIRLEKVTMGPGVVSADVSGAGASTSVPGPAPMIDWDAFMKDFEWNFDPSLIDTVVT